MILFDIIGIDICGDNLYVNPNLISNIKRIELKNITFRNKLYDIQIDENQKIKIVEK